MGIIYSLINADGDVDDNEINSLVTMALQRRVMQGNNVVQVYRRVAIAYRDMKNPAQYLEFAAAVLPANLRKPVFANAVDFAFADGYVGNAEKQALQMIQQALQLSDADAEQILAVIIEKNNC